jgi:hypothetical protein
MDYTLRIYTNGDGDFIDTDFETLDSLYTSIFDNWTPSNLGNPHDPVQLYSGWAVYDNSTGFCINSINAAQVGLDKTEAYRTFGPQV